MTDIGVRSAQLCKTGKAGAAISYKIDGVENQSWASPQGFARRLLRKMRSASDPRQATLWHTPLDCGHFWQARFYDFVVFSEQKRVEKLNYIHNNPVKRGLVLDPGQWCWSSYRHYMDGERGPVLVNKQQKAELTIRKVA